MKILGFDSWTAGSHHYVRLLPGFEARGMSLTLVHLGSWGNEPGRPKCEQIEDLSVKDISSYGHNSLDKMLCEEKPDAVILLSTQTFAHRALIRYCRLRGIPTLNLYHGLVAVQGIDSSEGSYKINAFAYIRFISSKFYKTFRYTLPCYIGALVKTHAKALDWIQFLIDLLRIGMGREALIAAEDAKTTRCCVYTQADIKHAVCTYGFAETDVTAVGNPDLIRFGLKQEMIGSRIAISDTGSQEIMYIDTGLASMGIFFKNNLEFVEHLKETASCLSKQGFKMLMKPKPSIINHMEFLAEELKGSNIELVTNDTFLQRLERCTACIVETTTLALVPALMGLPLLYARYGVLKELPFGPVLTSYPFGYTLEHVSDVSDILRKDAVTRDPETFKNWVALNAGPIPSEDMPERLGDVVLDMIRKYNRLGNNTISSRVN